MARIAVAGFQHETNTFAPAKATYQAFVEGGGWPPLLRGNELPARVHGMNLPMAGAIEVLEILGREESLARIREGIKKLELELGGSND